MKTWFITGSSSGIGKGIAKAVLEKGDNTVIMARDIKEDYPRTLVMGQDALNFVKGVYERKLKELEAWKETSVQSDYSFKR